MGGIGRCGGGRYGGGHYGGGRYSGTLQERVDGTAESPDTHLTLTLYTMDATAERQGGAVSYCSHIHCQYNCYNHSVAMFQKLNKGSLKIYQC